MGAAAQDARRAPQHLGGTVSRDALKRRVHIKNEAFRVGDDHRLVGLLNGRAQTRPLVFAALLLRNVLAGAQHAIDLA